ncbi:MAG: hypothetical protein ABL932_00100 [Terricaulis sp.]
MVTGGWPYILGAYALTVVVLGALAVFVMMRAVFWRRAVEDRARDSAAEQVPK